MDKLNIRMSVADIILVGRLIEKYMQENNIKKIDDVDAAIIQKKYDDIIKLDFPHIICPQCKAVSYNDNDIKYKFCGNCHEWHEYMKGEL